jgi:hypothetical protein
MEKFFKLEYPHGLMQKFNSGEISGKSVSAVGFHFMGWNKNDPKSLGDIFLYMPLTLENTNSVQWEQTDLKASGKAFQSMLENSGVSSQLNSLSSGMFNSDTEQLKEHLGILYDGATTFLKNMLTPSGVANAFVGDDVDLRGVDVSSKDGFMESLSQLNPMTMGDTAQAALVGMSNATRHSGIAEYTLKKVLNPYMTLMFRSVDFRTFNMEFHFTPHSERESIEIHNIIKTFRSAQLPATSGSFSFLEYPMQVEITYYNALMADNDYKNKWLWKFKPCVINNISINASGAGFYAPMRNGFPAETIMNITFTENEILTREDIEKGY